MPTSSPVLTIVSHTPPISTPSTQEKKTNPRTTMGAKKNNGGGGGGDNGKKGGDGAEKKKEDDPITVVLKIDMHCDGCTTKIVKTLKAFDGVDSVKPETGAHKLTVVGKVDPAKLREKLAGKLKKKVDLISPQPKKEKDDNGNNKKQPEKEKEEKKPKEPPVTTAVLKLNLHCQGCIEKIHKTVTKTKGFHDMSIDKEKELVTLKGAMDMKAVADSLKARLKRNVEIVPPKKDKDKDKDKDNKEKGEGGGDNSGGGKKKNKEEGDGGNAGGGKLDKMDFPAGVHPYGIVYGYDYPPQAMMYIGNQLHAPQIFSDENPNACLIM